MTPYLRVPLLAVLPTALLWLVSLLLFRFPSSFGHFCHILVIVNLQFYLNCYFFIYTFFFFLILSNDNKFIFFLNLISVVDWFMKWKCNDLQNMEDVFTKKILWGNKYVKWHANNFPYKDTVDLFPYLISMNLDCQLFIENNHQKIMNTKNINKLR